MEAIVQFCMELYAKFGPVIFIPLVIFIIVGIGSQWMLYEKCNLPGVACIVPVWNVIVFLKIVGRPWFHSLFVILPPLGALIIVLLGAYHITGLTILTVLGILWFGFMFKVYIEVCNSFGKRNTLDYILVIIFNGLYILNLGLSQESKYRGPVYKGNQKEQ